MSRVSDDEVLAKVHEGYRRVGLTFPYLAGLIGKLNIQLDRRVGTMGVFASGRLLVNPKFADGLSAQDLMFVLTHELYHLTLRTHDRAAGADPAAFNVAHDYIINDMLRHELGVEVIPAGGLDWRGARHMSAEKVMGELQKFPSSEPLLSWDPRALGGPFGGRLPGPAPKGPPGDVLDSALEKEWFPETCPADQQARAKEVLEQAARAASLQALMEALDGRGDDTGGQQNMVTALRGLYRPPWELALQRWLTATSPSERSYARPSRRGADRVDVVLPGRKREGWTLHLVLDTSGSMVEEVPRALGAIADFCEAAGVDEVRLIQCDTDVGSDEVLSPAEVARWQVTGYGGSDLTPAMQRLAGDPDVAAAIVLTDGDIAFPSEPMPYSLLWVLPAWKNPADFSPGYGNVIAMTNA